MSAVFGDARLPRRFWSKVVVDKTTGCWEWAAARRRDGYGSFGIGGGVTALTHRHAYLALVGEIPNGLEIDHLCRNRACCNPVHLEPVTKRVNVIRGDAPAAVNAEKTYCMHGHELTDENTYLNWSSGRDVPRRACKACRRRIDIKRSASPERMECRRKKARDAYRAKNKVSPSRFRVAK